MCIRDSSYIVYAPLLKGCTTILFEGKPVGTPDPGRRMTGLPERHSSTLLCFTWIKPNSLRLLSCESVFYFAG